METIFKLRKEFNSNEQSFKKTLITSNVCNDFSQ